MALDFSKYLSVEVDTIEAPRSAPAGHYFATFQDYKSEEAYYQGRGGPATPVVTILFKITGADEDAQEADSVGAEKAVNKVVRRSYDLTSEGGTYGLRRLVEETCGIDAKGLTLADALDAAKGSDVKIFNEPKAGKEEGQFYDNITKVLPVG